MFRKCAGAIFFTHQPIKCFTENDTPVNFSQKTRYCSVIASEFSSEIFSVFSMLYYLYTSIGAHNTSQIIPVKNYGSQSRASEANGIEFGYHNFLLVLFDWYYPHLYNYLLKLQLSTESSKSKHKFFMENRFQK